MQPSSVSITVPLVDVVSYMENKMLNHHELRPSNTPSARQQWVQNDASRGCDSLETQRPYDHDFLG